MDVTTSARRLSLVKWVNIILKLVKQIQAAQAERDPVAGKTTKRPKPPDHWSINY